MIHVNEYDVNEQRKCEKKHNQVASREIKTVKMHFQCKFTKLYFCEIYPPHGTLKILSFIPVPRYKKNT